MIHNEHQPGSGVAHNDLWKRGNSHLLTHSSLMSAVSHVLSILASHKQGGSAQKGGHGVNGQGGSGPLIHSVEHFLQGYCVKPGLGLDKKTCDFGRVSLEVFQFMVKT
jgi:hypothetical protein